MHDKKVRTKLHIAVSIELLVMRKLSLPVFGVHSLTREASTKIKTAAVLAVAGLWVVIPG
jgi:hypothetical protein